MSESGFFYPGNITGTVYLTAGPSMPGGVYVLQYHYHVWIVVGGIDAVQTSGTGTTGSISYYNSQCGVGAGGDGYVEAYCSDGVWRACSSGYSISGVTSMSSAYASILSPEAGEQQEFPTTFTGQTSGGCTATLMDMTTSTPVALGVPQITGNQWSVSLVGSLTHGHNYRFTVYVAGGWCESSASAFRDFSIPTYFTRTQSWDMTSALGPIVSQTWNLTANINKWLGASWYLYGQINSPLTTAPSQADIDAVLRMFHRFRARCLIKWDRAEWQDETDRLLSVQGVNDVDLSTRYLNTAEATIVLDNGDDRFTPQNRASPIYSNLQRIGQEIKIVAGYNNYETTVFYGRVNAITPRMGDRSVTLNCYDLGALWRQLKATYAPNALVDSDDIIREMLTDLGATENVDFVLDDGDVVIPYAIAPYVPLLSELQAITQAEGGRIFFDVNGVLNFWSRSHTRRVQAVPVIELNTDDHLYEIARSTSPAGLATRVSMEWNTRDAQTAEIIYDSKVVFQLSPGWLAETDELDEWGNPIMLAMPGPPVVVRAKPMDLTRWERGVPAEFTSLHTITANSARNGSGTSVPCSPGSPPGDGIVLPNPGHVYYQIAFGVGYADVQMANYGSQTVYVTALKLNGTPQRSISPTAVTVVDPDSASSYGDIELTLTNPYTPDADVAMDRAREELAIRKDPLAVLNIPLQDGIPFLRPFDVIRVRDRSVAGIEEVTDGQVLRNEWTINPSEGYTQRVALGAATPAQYRALVSVAQASELLSTSLVAPPFLWNQSYWSLAQWS